MTMSKILVRGRIFNPLSRSQWEYFPKGAFIINNQGRIEALGEHDNLKNTPGITLTQDYSDFLILPGLVDTHIHLPQLPIRGKTAGTLLEWLDRYAFPVEMAFSESTYAQNLSNLFFETLKANGTTTALVLSTVHEASTHIAFESAQQSGLRIAMGKVMMDQNAPASLLETTEDSINASIRLAERWHGQNNDLLRYAFTPRFALSCSSVLLEAAGDLWKRFPNSYLHSHLSENQKEIESVEALYANQYCYTQIYEKFGCLGPRTVMAHGIHLSTEELGILQDTGTRIAHCPTSNFFLKSGFFNIPRFLERNIPFGLGTDVGGGPDLSLFRVMRAMDEIQMHYERTVKPTEAIYYATLAGAEVLSLETETGNLLPGKSADFIVVDTQSLSPMETSGQTIEETISQLVYLGDSRQVRQTFVRGKEIYQADRQSQGFTREYGSIRLSEPLLPQLQMQ